MAAGSQQPRFRTARPESPLKDWSLLGAGLWSKAGPPPSLPRGKTKGLRPRLGRDCPPGPEPAMLMLGYRGGIWLGEERVAAQRFGLGLVPRFPTSSMAKARSHTAEGLSAVAVEVPSGTVFAKPLLGQSRRAQGARRGVGLSPGRPRRECLPSPFSCDVRDIKLERQGAFGLAGRGRQGIDDAFDADQAVPHGPLHRESAKKALVAGDPRDHDMGEWWMPSGGILGHCRASLRKHRFSRIERH